MGWASQSKGRSWVLVEELELNGKQKLALYHAVPMVYSCSCWGSELCLFVTSWIEARQASLSLTVSWSLLKLMFIESMMPSSHLILCHPLLLLPSIFPSIRVFSNESCQREGGKCGNSDRLFSWAPKSLQTVTAAMKWKDTCSLEESCTQPRQHIKKQMITNS